MTNKITRRIISMLLAITLLFLTTIPVFAAGGYREEYISDLRIVYASDYVDAKRTLTDLGLKDYYVFNANLNENTGKKGVFLAYKTTTNIEDAITDIAVMQMNGGYSEGNYQQMIKDSYSDYLALGDNYLTAIEYFNEAYDAGNYLAEIAHRQLNFYNVVTEGDLEKPDFEGMHLGDIFYEGVDSSDLATMFLEGNSYALSNIRSLIAMGVSYNETDLTYLELVAIDAKEYGENKNPFINRDYEDIAKIIAPTITVFRDMFEELEAHEDDLNYADEEITEKELYYAEYKLMSEMAKATDYIDGKTFYEFCLEYNSDKHGYAKLYPLVSAMNEGQLAMTKVAHYYDVVRYSMTLQSNEDIEAKLAEMEEKYSQNPFNVYTGVDRTIYRDSFALTNAAYRADASTESGISEALYGGKLSGLNVAATVVGSVGAAYLAFGLGKFGYSLWTAKKALDVYQVQYDQILGSFAKTTILDIGSYEESTARFAINYLCDEYVKINGGYDIDVVSSWTLSEKYHFLETHCTPNSFGTNSANYVDAFNQIKTQFEAYQTNSGNSVFLSAQSKAAAATQNVKDSFSFLKGATAIGGLMMLVSAIKLGYSIWHYYHPEYTDIPTAMVDLINTPDGDRYIKYDVVYEAEPRSDGTLIAGDLNAFSAERWNALYYTKSYEAGKPILAYDYVVSHTSNVPPENHMPIHRFGEVVCYNLNKYNFDDDYSIYLSVKQSDNQKAAIKDVPEVVGSMFSTGYMILAGGVGIAAGVGGTIGTVEIIKRRKNKKNTEAEATE